MSSTINPMDVAGIRAQAKLLSNRLCAAVLPVDRSKKPGCKGWQLLTPEESTTSQALKKFSLRYPNIGILLGERSNNLCSIDCDSDELLRDFIASNPKLEQTLISNARRGGNVWVRLTGNYPNTTKLKRNGSNCGEFRSNGAQTILYGIHPEGMRYRSNDKLPLEISFSEINWLDVEPFGGTTSIIAGFTERQRDRETDGTDESDVSDDTHVVMESSAVGSLSDLIAQTVPTQVHANHAHIFKFARGLLTLEERLRQKFSHAESVGAFDQWYAATDAAGKLRAGEPKEKYLIEFLDARDGAKVPLGKEAITAAWNRAKSEPLPKEAEMVQQVGIKQLVALCYQLQKLHGNKTFFIGCRKAAELIGKTTAQTTASWLRYLGKLGIIKLIDKGSKRTNKASRFLYTSLVNDHDAPNENE